MKIIKRNGAEENFDISKIIMAVTKANAAVEECDRMTPRQIQRIAESVELACQELGRSAAVEEIQDMVEKQIMAHGAFEVAKAYITYRYTRSLVRRANTTDDRILSLIECNNEEAKQENSNKNPIVNSTQRDYMAGEVSRDITSRLLLPKDIVEAHEEGIIHFHDADYYAQHMHNCDLVNLEDMLENGTVITGTLIERPHSFSTACNIATQIIAQVASNQYGGQSISLTHLAPFVQVSRERIRREVEAEMQAIDAHPGEEKLAELVENRVREEIRRGVQTIQYQVVTLLTTNGQAPFVTVFMYLGEAKNEQERHDLAMIIEETLRQRYQGVKNEKGVWVTPAFPKLIYVLEEDNIHEDSPYWYLTELAARCTAKRMVPDYISEKKMLELKVDKNGEGHCYTCMGCRSFLTPYIDPETGKPKYYGRFNQGVVTINLPDVALSSGGNMEKFWKIFDERLELCHRALMCRHERLKGTLSDSAPILWQYGALARLKKRKKPCAPWALAVFMSPTPVQAKPAQVPYFPYLLCVVDTGSGKGLTLTPPRKIDEYAPHFSADFLPLLQQHGLPREFWSADDRTTAFITPIAKQLGIPVNVQADMTPMDELLDELYDHLNDASFEGADEMGNAPDDAEVLRLLAAHIADAPETLRAIPDYMLTEIRAAIAALPNSRDALRALDEEIKRRRLPPHQ